MVGISYRIGMSYRRLSSCIGAEVEILCTGKASHTTDGELLTPLRYPSAGSHYFAHMVPFALFTPRRCRSSCTAASATFNTRLLQYCHIRSLIMPVYCPDEFLALETVAVCGPEPFLALCSLVFAARSVQFPQLVAYPPLNRCAKIASLRPPECST